MQYYVLLSELAEKPGAVELAQVTAQINQQPASPDVLDKVLRGEATTGTPPDELERANKSVERIGEAISDAQALMNGFLRQRGYKMPFSRVPRLLTTWGRAITRYFLHQHRLSNEKDDPIVRDYKEAMRLLQLVADGKLSLGVDDPIPAGGGNPAISTPGRTFSFDSLKDYGK